jgi:hypothetical protein
MDHRPSQAVAKRRDAKIIRPSDLLCRSRRCAIEKDGAPLYFDDQHVNQFGARYVAPLLAPALR